MTSFPHRPLFLAAALVTTLGASACDDGDAPPPADSSRPSVAIPDPSSPAVGDSLLNGPGTHWATHGGGLAQHRFSPLDQIDPSTVDELVPVWVHATGLEGAFAATPLVVGNTLYISTARGRVRALNAATGQQLWTYAPQLGPVTLCCGPSNRGVSAYGTLVYVTQPDAKVVALDARTGEPAWETRLADPTRGYSTTMSPLAVDGRVFVGVAGERYGIRGFLVALDAEGGDELWRWHTIPHPDSGGWWGEWSQTDPFGTPLERDIAKERADSTNVPGSWVFGGGGIATTPAYDRQSGRVYVNVEGPAPLVDGSMRPGDNLYTGSIVALDAATGRKVWHAQYLPHDVWGLSGGSPPFLFDRGGERYVAFAGRTGWLYVFRADTGQPVLRSDNFVPQEAMFRRPGTEQPEGEGEGVRVAPGANGGNAGAGVAYDPRTGTAFVGGVHQPMVYSTRSEPYREGQLWLGGEVRFPPGEEQWGTVSAVDLGTGEIRWQKRTPAPVHSDVLATAGDLVFVGQGSGTLDAFHARTGQLLWQFETGAGMHGGPVTYEVAGVQYVVAPAGGSFHFGTPPGDDLIAFALANRRPPTSVNDYPSASYTRGGATMAGSAQVRQRRTAPPPPDTAETPASAGDRPGSPSVDSTGTRR